MKASSNSSLSTRPRNPNKKSKKFQENEELENRSLNGSISQITPQELMNELLWYILLLLLRMLRIILRIQSIYILQWMLFTFKLIKTQKLQNSLRSRNFQQSYWNKSMQLLNQNKPLLLKLTQISTILLEKSKISSKTPLLISQKKQLLKECFKTQRQRKLVLYISMGKDNKFLSTFQLWQVLKNFKRTLNSSLFLTLQKLHSNSSTFNLYLHSLEDSLLKIMMSNRWDQWSLILQ